MKTYLFNPYTGKPRHPPDIASDPAGLLIAEPGEPLVAASPPPQSAQLIEPGTDFFGEPYAKDPISDHAQAALYNFTQGTPHHAAVRTLYSLAHQFVNLPKAGSGLMEGKDAARYRWLRDKSEPNICAFYLSVGMGLHGVKFVPATVDEAIDAAMKAEQSGRTDAALSQGQQTEQGSRNG